jgi:ABC-type ATPase with predicted acetyltransferase domain
LIRVDEMSAYHIHFWRGQNHIIDYEDDEYPSVEEARRHVEDIIREMMKDTMTEDWTGCRFEVTTVEGSPVLQIPVLTMMSAIARRTHH